MDDVGNDDGGIEDVEVLTHEQYLIKSIESWHEWITVFIANVTVLLQTLNNFWIRSTNQLTSSANAGVFVGGDRTSRKFVRNVSFRFC